LEKLFLFLKRVIEGVDPEGVGYNPSVEKIYNATISLARIGPQNFFLPLKKLSSLQRCSCEF
jgi:hypothetical protein